MADAAASLSKEAFAELAKQLGITLRPEDVDVVMGMVNASAKSQAIIRSLPVDPDVAPDMLTDQENE